MNSTKGRAEFTGPIAKSLNPRLLHTPFFACCLEPGSLWRKIGKLCSEKHKKKKATESTQAGPGEKERVATLPSPPSLLPAYPLLSHLSSYSPFSTLRSLVPGSPKLGREYQLISKKIHIGFNLSRQKIYIINIKIKDKMRPNWVNSFNGYLP